MHAGTQALKHNLWFVVIVRYEEEEGDVMSTYFVVVVLWGVFGAYWSAGLLSAEQAFQHHGQIPDRPEEPNISISETCHPPLHQLFTSRGMHFHGIVSGSLQTHYNSKTKQKSQDETR